MSMCVCVCECLYVPPPLYLPCYRSRLSRRTCENTNGHKSQPRGRRCRVSAAVAATNRWAHLIICNPRETTLNPTRSTHLTPRIGWNTHRFETTIRSTIYVYDSIILRPIAGLRYIYTLLTSNAKYFVMWGLITGEFYRMVGYIRYRVYCFTKTRCYEICTRRQRTLKGLMEKIINWNSLFSNYKIMYLTSHSIVSK